MFHNSTFRLMRRSSHASDSPGALLKRVDSFVNLGIHLAKERSVSYVD